jgi:uncharacterized protein YegP (UPF0339 family)
VPASFVLKKLAERQFCFFLTAENDEPILTSETYTTKAGAQGGIQSVRDNSTTDHFFERKQAADGSHSFVLMAPNGETIGHSQPYPYLDAAERGVASVKRVARRAPIREEI